MSLDKNLMVKLSDGRIGYIIGNPHTFRGRFEVSFALHSSMSCSISDVEPLTPQARYWLMGYLSAMEPSPYEVLREAYKEDLENDSEPIQKWRAAVERFHLDGRWRSSEWDVE